MTDVAVEVVAQYLEHPVLFKGNAGKGNFDLLNYGDTFKNGQFNATAQNTLCLLYQFATENVPSSLSGVLELPLEVVSWAVGKLNPVCANLCFFPPPPGLFPSRGVTRPSILKHSSILCTGMANILLAY